MMLDTDVLAHLAWAQLWQVTVAIALIALLVRLIGCKSPHLGYGLWMQGDCTISHVPKSTFSR